MAYGETNIEFKDTETFVLYTLLQSHECTSANKRINELICGCPHVHKDGFVRKLYSNNYIVVIVNNGYKEVGGVFEGC